MRSVEGIFLEGYVMRKEQISGHLITLLCIS